MYTAAGAAQQFVATILKIRQVSLIKTTNKLVFLYKVFALMHIREGSALAIGGPSCECGTVMDVHPARLQ